MSKIVYNPLHKEELQLLADGKDFDDRYINKIKTTTGIDIGAEANSSTDSVGEDYIVDKRISHCLLGSNERDEEGAIRQLDGVFQIYLNGVWNDVVINFRLREDSNGAYELEHKPIGFDWWYEVMSGNSDKTDFQGTPLVQQYTSSIGAIQPNLLLNGGEF